ncbi:MAG: hypothetical protein ABW148_17250 [Sedimenticola sp.]
MNETIINLVAILFAAPLLFFTLIQAGFYGFKGVFSQHRYLASASIIVNAAASFVVGHEVVIFAEHFPRSIVTVMDVWLGSIWFPVYPLAFIVTALFTVIVTYSVLHYANRP